MIKELDAIPVGDDDGKQHRGAAAFEDWCKKTTSFLLKGEFDPIGLHVNGMVFSRRDLVAANSEEPISVSESERAMNRVWELLCWGPVAQSPRIPMRCRPA